MNNLIKKCEIFIYNKRILKKDTLYIKMESDVDKKTDVIEKNKHIMFSYCWEQQHNVRHIYEIINNEFNEVPKWIDTEGMSGNIIDAMHDAIENAFLVLVFLSKDYKNSKNCKIESEFIIGKQKDYILVLMDNNFPYNEENEKKHDSWIYKMYKDQFYVDMSKGMEKDKITKLLDLIRKKINDYYGINTIKKRATFGSKMRAGFGKSKRISPNNSPALLSTRSSSLGSNLMPHINELDNFILTNNLEQDEVDNIKHLVEKTPRTMIPTLKAGGLSFKGILEIITDIKNENLEEDDYALS